MDHDLFQWLQNWYWSQCDGDWEHEYVIKIESLDNPGWYVKIDLDGTELEEADFSRMQINRTENDWILCLKEEKQFRGGGGPLNLIEVLQIFREWAEKNAAKQ